MPITYVSGDPLLTGCDMLAIGHNAKGRTELDEFTMRVMRQTPAAFSTYTRKARQGRIATGEIFSWRESVPQLLFLCIRESSYGATRLRYVQSILVTLARDYKLYQLKSLAIAPLGRDHEQGEINRLYESWLKKSRLHVVIYEQVIDGVQADEGL